MRTRRRRLIARKNGQLETPVNVPTLEEVIAVGVMTDKATRISKPPKKQAKKQARK